MIRKHIPARVITLYHFDELTEQAQRRAVINVVGIDEEYFNERKFEQMREYLYCENGIDGWSVLEDLYYNYIEKGMPFTELSSKNIKIYEDFYGIAVKLIDVYLDGKEGAAFLKYWLDKSDIKIKYNLEKFFLKDVLSEVYINENGVLHIEFDCDICNKDMPYTSIYLEKVSYKLAEFIQTNFIKVINSKMNESIRKLQEYNESEQFKEDIIEDGYYYIEDYMLFFEDGTLYESLNKRA